MTVSLAIVRAHARLSPSKAHRWLVCPGSMHVTAEDPETEWAAEGTRKHAVLELVLRGVPLIAGDVITTLAGDYKVPLEVLEQCHEIREFIEQFKSTHPGWTVETETPVEVGAHVWPNMARGISAGTTDACAYDYRELLVLDAKFGFVQVEARGNPQLMLYALGLVAEIPFPIEWVTLCIAQPGWDGLVQFREHRMKVEALHEWALQVQSVVEEIQAGSYRLQADDHACRYCAARTQCPARLKALQDFNTAEWLQDRPLEELLPLVPRIRAICKDLEQRAMADLASGKPVRGYKLVASKSKRRWPEGLDVPVLLVNALPELDIKDPRLYEEPKLKSPAQMEKAIRSIVGKKMTVKEAKTVVDAVAIVPSGSPKLAPETDERPALEAGGFTLEDVLKASLEEHDAD